MKKIRSIALASLGVAAGVFAMKWLAADLTGSLAMRANAMEKLLNIATACIVLASLLARRDAHSPTVAERLASALLALLIGYAGLSLLQQAVSAADAVAQTLSAAGLAVSLLASVLNGLWGMILVRAGRWHHAPAMVADGRHLQADVLGSLVILSGVMLQTSWLDRLLAVAVALLLFHRAWHVLRDVLRWSQPHVRPALVE